MKKLSEYKDEEALDLLAELIEPAGDIFSDKEVVTQIRSKNKMAAISLAIKNHKKSVIEIMAVLDGVPVREFHCNILTLPGQLVEILNDEDLWDFFVSQGLMEEQTPSGSAMGTTEEEEK